MPCDGKVCSFDCLYCEAGFNAQGPGRAGLPPRHVVQQLLEQKLTQMRTDGAQLDVITFSGNGEPTLHPEFGDVVVDTIKLRNTFFPEAKVSVLTNSTQLHRPDVVDALKMVDNNILKLDSAVEATMRLIDRPKSPTFTVASVIDQLKAFAGTGIIQTMILRGSWEGRHIDNSTPAEVDALIQAYRAIAPREVMLYSIDRKTPAQSLEKVDIAELHVIADKITAETSIPVQVN
jgi:wyosine [tRNA(Phe)-imidazoG37] synthetase (radical SAM superfamily)